LPTLRITVVGWEGVEASVRFLWPDGGVDEVRVDLAAFDLADGDDLDTIATAHRPGAPADSFRGIVDVRREPSNTDGRARMQAFGAGLFEALFIDALRERFRAMRRAVASRDEVLRIAFHDASSEGRSLPWELLRDPGCVEDAWDGFLALASDIELVECTSGEAPDDAAHTAGAGRETSPSVLFLGVSPKDHPAANVDQEFKALADASMSAGLAGRRVALGPGVPTRITREVLLEVGSPAGARSDAPASIAPEGCNMVHVAGHGDPNPVTGILDFLIERADGACDRVEGSLIVQAALAGRDVAIAVANCCWGLGLARHFVRRGASQAIGNRGRVSDRAAVEFCQVFYSRVFMGVPVGDALREARREVWQLARPSHGAGASVRARVQLTDWANPVWRVGPSPWMPEGAAAGCEAEATRRQGAAAPLPRPAPGPGRGRRWHGWAAGGVVIALAVAAGIAVWPTHPRIPSRPVLAVLPAVLPESVLPATGPEAVLWPLLDRMVVNAIEPLETVNRVTRVSPVLVEESLLHRSLPLPVPAPAADELLERLAADLGLQFAVSRQQGQVVLEASLHVRGDRRVLALRARGTNEQEAVQSLVDDLARILPDGIVMDAEGQREMKLASAWAAFLRRPDRTGPESPSAVLAVEAATTSDESLRDFLVAMSGPRKLAVEACARLDAGAIGRRHPRWLGTMAEAACLERKGSPAAAVTKAMEALGIPFLRESADAFIRAQLHYERTCDDVVAIRRKLIRLTPDRPGAWAALGSWLAKCGAADESMQALRVARYLAVDGRSRFIVGYNGTLASLLQLDIEGARSDWLDLLEDAGANLPSDRLDRMVLKGLYENLRGRFGDAVRTMASGLESCGDDWRDYQCGFLATGLVFALLELDEPDVEGASEVVAAFRNSLDKNRPAHKDPGSDAFHADMLELAVGAARSRDPSGVAIGIAAASRSRDVLDLPRWTMERDSCEAMLRAMLGDEQGCVELLFRSTIDRTYMGGCRFFYAGSLERAGQVAEAERQYEQSLNEMIWARFLFARLIPRAMLGRARMLERLGRSQEAAALYGRIEKNYADRDRPMVEVIEAAAGRARLASGRALPLP
jgi:tetratricopeptide (TPR) repeat protein